MFSSVIDWVVAAKWLFAVAIAIERTWHLSWNRRAAFWLATAFFTAALSGVLASGYGEHSSFARVTSGVGGLFCAISAGAHLAVFVLARRAAGTMVD